MLSWLESPKIDAYRDLDSHLYATFGCETYYQVKSCSSGKHSVVLDRDDVDYGGPETITVTETGGAGAVYNHFVYGYSYPNSFVGSHAQVTLFDQYGVSKVLTVEEATKSPDFDPRWRFWHTFRFAVIG